jgi:hypothetical protein
MIFMSLKCKEEKTIDSFLVFSPRRTLTCAKFLSVREVDSNIYIFKVISQLLVHPSWLNRSAPYVIQTPLFWAY